MIAYLTSITPLDYEVQRGKKMPVLFTTVSPVTGCQ